MKCPICNLALTLNDAEEHIGYTCADCEGIWLPSSYLESLKHLHEFSAEKFRESLDGHRAETNSKRSCPSCNQTLETSTTQIITTGGTKAYRAFVKECKILGWFCFGASLLLEILQK